MGFRRVKVYSGYFLVFVGFQFALREIEGLMLKVGSCVLCGTTPEQFALALTESILGGVNTLDSVASEPCQQRKRELRRYRTYDGTCNAFEDRGSAFSYVKRLMPPNYEGPNHLPRTLSSKGSRLSSARAISRAVHRPKQTNTTYTLLAMQFGQLLDHDISVVPLPVRTNATNKCCGVPEKDRYHGCLPIEIPPGDPVFKDCMEFVRSEPVTSSNGTIPEPRTHLNAITSWIDASMTYGSDDVKAKSLRYDNGSGALLETSWYKGKERLPRGQDRDCINLEPHHYCSKAGDGRVNEQPALASMHAVFHMEHNRLVRKLAEILLYRRGQPYSPYYVEQYLKTAPPAVQERIYQIIRKVLGGVWQSIVYNEYVPLVIGPYYMSKYKLWGGERCAYDPEIDPSISMEFLTAAYRFGHTIISDMMFTDKLQYLRDIFSTSKHYLDSFESIIKGLVTSDNHAQKFDMNMADSVVNHLFANNRAGRPGFDLASINIQRGRDHGLPTYNEVRAFFGLKKRRTWEEFGEGWQALKTVYEDPDDVDLFTGGTSESSVQDGIVGDTFANVLGQQFHDLKYGDLHYFETDNSYYGFSEDEIRELKKLLLSKILCENAKLEWIQPNPFKQVDYYRTLTCGCSATTSTKQVKRGKRLPITFPATEDNKV